MVTHRTIRHFAIGLVCLFAALGSPSRAEACGASGPDGIAYCSLSEHHDYTRPLWAVGLSGLYTSTNIHFSHGVKGDETRDELLAAVAYMPSARVTLQAGLGATFGGHLDMPDGRHDFSVGPAVLLGAAWRAIDQDEFVILSSALSFSASQTQQAMQTREAYEAFDLRLGAVFGVTLFDTLSPYVPLRVFGGPIFWRYAGQAVTGTDAYHYQVGLGIALHIGPHFNVFAEGIPLGEKALAAGVTWTP